MIGGQGVFEGVMMKSPDKSALSVRKENGTIELEQWANKKRTGKLVGLPVIRGIIAFVDMMGSGYSTIMKSAQLYDDDAEGEFEPSRLEKKIAEKTGKDATDVMIVIAAVLGVLLAVGLFFVLPTVITDLIKGSIENTVVLNLIEGLIRLTIMMIYMFSIRFIKDIARVFGYHGAEHKTINCYEHDMELTVENVRACSRLHPRCGTSYILIVMIVSIIVYSLTGWDLKGILKILAKIALLPLISGISYEILKFAARGDGICFRILRWPGMQLQRLTTMEPDDGMMQCAILSFEAVLGDRDEGEIESMRKAFSGIAEESVKEDPEGTALPGEDREGSLKEDEQA